MAPSGSYSFTLGPNIGTVDILGALGNAQLHPPAACLPKHSPQLPGDLIQLRNVCIHGSKNCFSERAGLAANDRPRKLHVAPCDIFQHGSTYETHAKTSSTHTA